MVLKIICKNCGGKCVKGGFDSKSNQRYKCVECGVRQFSKYTYNAYDSTKRDNVLELYKSGHPKIDIAKTLGIARDTISKIIKEHPKVKPQRKITKKNIVSSLSYNQHQVIKNILKLHVPQGFIDCDPTYSIGNFYNNSGIQQPKYKFDIMPQIKGVKKADCRELPLKDKSINCLMFDPPFVVSTVPPLNGKRRGDNKSNIIRYRFGCFKSIQELKDVYLKSMKEFYRVLNNKGVLIFKCQDTVISTEKNLFSHVQIMNDAIEIGFRAKDLFILGSKNRVLSGHVTQRHARKYHAYFWVFIKK